MSLERSAESNKQIISFVWGGGGQTHIFAYAYNFFCWKIDFSASGEGDQTLLDFCRHRSLSEARIDTTSWRLSGLSGEATGYEFPSLREASCKAASLICAPVSGASSLLLSLRIDMVLEGGDSCVLYD